jgi:hypothetical protein
VRGVGENDDDFPLLLDGPRRQVPPLDELGANLFVEIVDDAVRASAIQGRLQAITQIVVKQVECAGDAVHEHAAHARNRVGEN